MQDVEFLQQEKSYNKQENRLGGIVMDRKEAIEVIRKNWPHSGHTMLREALETLIPELAESDDEKIRNSYERQTSGFRATTSY